MLYSQFFGYILSGYIFGLVVLIYDDTTAKIPTSVLNIACKITTK